MLVHPTLSNPKINEKSRAFSQYLGDKYGYNTTEAEGAAARCADIVQFLVARLEQQQTKGSKFYIGNQLSALDIYSSTFAALIQPLPHEQCPMPDPFRKMYTNTDPGIQAAAKPILFVHRDFIYREYLELPIDL
jgi:hypothetical protein